MIILIRHGETEFNIERRIQGTMDSPLTDLGKQQAEQASGQLGALLGDSRRNAFFVSPLGRAVHTAEIIAEPLQVTFLLWEDIMERDHGVWEGEIGPELDQKFDRTEYHADKWNYDGHGGESYAQLTDRCQKVHVALQDLQRQYENVVIVSHGSFIKFLLRVNDEKEHEDLYIKNGHPIIMEVENKTHRFV